MMAKIIEVIEGSQWNIKRILSNMSLEPQHDIANAISSATRAIVEAMPVHAIIALTLTGNTAKLIARQRPHVPILAFTPWESTYRRLNLVWGVTPVMGVYADRLVKLSRHVYEILLEQQCAGPDDLVVLVGGHPLATLGSTNFLKIVRVSSLDTSATDTTFG
jgi:pyruvate kinase